MAKETQRGRIATRQTNKTFKKVAKAEVDLNQGRLIRRNDFS